ncbi:GGDEF domain-containing protein [Yunchengibacter salinarum]|uniref:GGDEF domain-containing protein n=1 Tax=Yunchengibacter salinarum TaxID=3133399 RepID=UPI0035B59D94
MGHQSARTDREAINPYVSQLASRLIETATQAELKVDSTGWQLITEMLSFAASAEQRMAEQQERIEALEQLSVTDELTGIANLRGLRRALRETLSHSARHRLSGVLGFIDLDDFKDINDQYGHMVGDSLLRHVASTLGAQVRPTDSVARIAGDEFAVILTGCSEQEGVQRLRQLQRTLNATCLHSPEGRVAVQCSIGVAPFDGLTDPSALIEAADRAMYQDKENRRGAHLKVL